MSEIKVENFEQSIFRLDTIVKTLERGDAPLNELLSLFEEGTSLIKTCQTMLDNAEQKVTKLRRGENGEPEHLPFDAEEA